MLEVIILFRLCRRIGRAARAKGRGATRFQVLLLLLWFGGEIGAGLAFAAALTWGFRVDPDEYILFFYLAALIGAAAGAWLAFRIVGRLPEPVEEDPDWADPQPPTVQPLS
jgi:hypothetical protein